MYCVESTTHYQLMLVCKCEWEIQVQKESKICVGLKTLDV